jgi:hypothetical protein
MNWYKIKIEDGSERGYTLVGSSPDSLDQLTKKAMRGEFLRLDNLLWYDRGEIREWIDWDRREAPIACINPAHVVMIQPFNGDPRTLPK